MCEVNDKMSYEKFKVFQTILPKRGIMRKTQTCTVMLSGGDH